MSPVSEQLESLFSEKLDGLRRWNKELYDEGLILDFLYEHVANRTKRNQLDIDYATAIYSHTGLDVPALVKECKELGLLTDVPSEDPDAPEVTHFANRAFSPLIKDRFRKSEKPGQRARKVLEHRAIEWEGTGEAKGKNAISRALHAMLAVLWKLINAGKGKEERVTLHSIDVQTVLRGKSGMRALRIEESNLLEASQAEVRIYRNALLGLLVMTVLFFVSIAWVSQERTKADLLNYSSVVIAQADSLLKDNDPLTAALLVASLVDVEDPTSGIRVAHEIAKNSIPKDIYEHSSNVNSVACNSDGSEVLIASDNGTLVWNTSNAGHESVRLNDTLVLGAVFNRSTNGPRLATFTSNNEIIAWDKITRTVVDEETGEFREESQWCEYLVGVHDDEIVSLDFSAGGGLLLASSSNENLQGRRNSPEPRSEMRIWEVAGLNAGPLGNCPIAPMVDHEPKGILPSYQKATFSNGDSHHFAIVKADASSAIILSAVDRQPVEKQVFEYRVNGGDGTAEADSEAEGEAENEGVAVPIEQVVFSQDNRMLLLVHTDAPATLWTVDLAGNQAPVHMPLVFPAIRKARFIGPDRLLAATMNNQVITWQLTWVEDEKTGQPVLQAERVMEFAHIGEKFKDMDYCPETNQIVTSLAVDTNGVHEVRLWNGQGAIEPMRISYATLDYKVREKLIPPEPEGVFSIDDKLVFYPAMTDSGSEPAGMGEFKIFEHGSQVEDAAFHAGTNRLATAASDGLVRVFELNSARAAGDDPETRITNTETSRRYSVGRRKDTPTVNAGAIDVDFNDDGSLLLGASNEGKVWIWQLDGEGENVVIATGMTDLASANFGPDDSPLGDRVQTSNSAGDVQFWRYQWGDLVEALNDSTVLCLDEDQREIYLPELKSRRRPMNGRCEISSNETAQEPGDMEAAEPDSD